MNNKILEIKKEELDAMNISDLASTIINTEYKNYFLAKSGDEHYRLLAYISSLYENITILDIGTFKGGSALAFSSNKKNTVYSFDVINHLELNKIPENVFFIVDDILKKDYEGLILSSPVIFIDTLHDGIFETEFLEKLRSLGYEGIVIFDDIHYFYPLKEMWEGIYETKYDITKIGHWSGTGIIELKKDASNDN